MFHGYYLPGKLVQEMKRDGQCFYASALLLGMQAELCPCEEVVVI